MAQPQLSVIMAHLNEGDEPLVTAKSALETSPPGFVEVIAIDDCSDQGKYADLGGIEGVRAFRNKRRLGLFATKDFAIGHANAGNLMVIDAHMRFKRDGWAERVVGALAAEPETVFCTTCLGLGWRGGKNNEPLVPPDMTKPNGRYYGATLVIRGEKNTSQGKRMHWLEPKWQGRQSTDAEYELPCVLGANYGIRKDWWLRIGGLRGLRGWGGQEACLSLKTWLSGGRCKILTDIEIGHIFRSAAPYPASHAAIWHNRMRMALTLLPEPYSERIYREIADKYPAGAKLVEEDKRQVLSERAAFMRIHRPGSLEALVERFKLQMEWKT